MLAGEKSLLIAQAHLGIVVMTDDHRIEGTQKSDGMQGVPSLHVAMVAGSQLEYSGEQFVLAGKVGQESAGKFAVPGGIDRGQGKAVDHPIFQREGKIDTGQGFQGVWQVALVGRRRLQAFQQGGVVPLQQGHEQSGLALEIMIQRYRKLE